HSGGKVGVLYQNDDYGKDYVKGLEDGLGDRVKLIIVSEAPYETADTTVDSQIVALKASGADISSTSSHRNLPPRPSVQAPNSDGRQSISSTSPVLRSGQH